MLLMHIDICSLKIFKVSGPSSYCSGIGKSTECLMMTFKYVIHLQMLLVVGFSIISLS